MKKNNELLSFALKFILISGILLPVFYLIYPFYENVLRSILPVFSSIAYVTHPSRILVVTMPFVILSALILSMPKGTLFRKSKFLLLGYIVFFLVDVSFLFLQISLPSLENQILLVDDFFTIFLPIIFWWLLSYKDFNVFLSA